MVGYKIEVRLPFRQIKGIAGVNNKLLIMKSRIVKINKRRSNAIFLKSFGGRYKISVDECADLSFVLKRLI